MKLFQKLRECDPVSLAIVACCILLLLIVCGVVALSCSVERGIRELKRQTERRTIVVSTVAEEPSVCPEAANAFAASFGLNPASATVSGPEASGEERIGLIVIEACIRGAVEDRTAAEYIRNLSKKQAPGAREEEPTLYFL